MISIFMPKHISNGPSGQTFMLTNFDLIWQDWWKGWIRDRSRDARWRWGNSSNDERRMKIKDHYQ